MKDEDINVPSELVKNTGELSILKPHLPSTKINILVKKIDNLLDEYIDNELMFAKLVKDGAVYKNAAGENCISDTAIAVHRARKDSVSELVKVKMTLEGIATEHKSVVHRFDVNGLLEALRSARVGKVGRTDDRM